MNKTHSHLAAIAIFGLGFVMSAGSAIADRHGNKYVHSRPFQGQTYVMYQDHMSLYTYGEDQVGKSNCYDECAENWPPATFDAGTRMGENYSLIERADGTMQAAFRGMPLYLFSKDRKPGDLLGDGVGGVWQLARP